jgi:YegS/Rv2252/BmrU family lipid kinase
MVAAKPKRLKSKRSLEQRAKRERTAVLIVNTHSRQGEKFFFAAMDELARRGIWIAASYPVRDPARLRECVEEAISRGQSLVIVGGGDGTISSIVDYFAHKDLVLGVLPLGTGNSFARSLGIPMTLEGAVDVIANGKVADVDLGKVGDLCFANIATIGLSVDIGRSSPVALKRSLGVLAGMLVAVPAIFRHQPFHCRIIVDGVEHTIETHEVIVANGSFFGVTQLAQNASPDNGRLIVYAMDTPSNWHMLKLWMALLLGRPRAFPEARYFRAQDVIIETDSPHDVDVDGEILTETPARFTLLPQALKVMTPKSFVDKT